ncbi:hypothetical protein B0H16DRAFT_1763437 [Mycena metata]|uniref:Uncharacterized protein n=1 Tax=Mycena metata TaxID=1033252 RepID=A0AAD7NT88_9AGAR|nr:hypothetical protein B0H16DRAFT_1763437 [Mycena metata]
MSSSEEPPPDSVVAAQPSAEDAEAAATEAINALLNRADQGSDDTPSLKRKHADKDDISLTLKDYGRAFLRLGDPFTPVDDIIQHGIFIETTEEVDYPKMNKRQREVFDRNTESWEILWRMIGQSFREQMIILTKNQDASTIKKNIINYLLADTSAALDPPLQPSTRVNRGRHHTVTARLTCPAKRVPDENTFKGIATGAIPVTGKSFRRFFYPDDWTYVKDPVTKESNIMDNLFEGHLMIRVAKCILQGPSSALKGPGAGRGDQGNAAKIGARAITKRLMGYIGIQTLFGISDLETWKQVDGTFDYEEFYWTIVSLFDDDDNAQVLEHFNHQVFGNAAGNVKPSTSASDAAASDDDEESDLDAYKALRAAKKARLDAAAATTTQ